MPIISEIGRRSMKMRILFALIYLLLAVGLKSALHALSHGADGGWFGEERYGLCAEHALD